MMKVMYFNRQLYKIIMIISLNPKRVVSYYIKDRDMAAVCGERLAADQRCSQITCRLLSVKYDVVLRLTLNLM